MPSLGERPLQGGVSHSRPSTCARSTIHGPAPFHQSPNRTSFCVPGTTSIPTHLLFFFLILGAKVQFSRSVVSDSL